MSSPPPPPPGPPPAPASRDSIAGEMEFVGVVHIPDTKKWQVLAQRSADPAAAHEPPVSVCGVACLPQDWPFLGERDIGEVLPLVFLLHVITITA